MKTSPTRQELAIDEQAATWAARLDGDVLDASERIALDAWLAESPAHRAALSQYCQFSADLEEQLPVLVETGAVKMPAPKKARGKILSFPRIASVALAAAAALAVGLWAVRPAPEIKNLVTGVAQRSATTLLDGTRVELNAHTSLRFENRKNERRVRLASGEAMFHVAKDATRPFIVETPTGSVRVTGTVFNVRAEPADRVFEVTVVEGSVNVRPREAGEDVFSLTANDHLSARARNVDRRAFSAAELDDILAWRNGQIVFKDTPLSEAVARFARHHGRSITIPDSLAEATIGGLHSIDDLPGFVAGVQSAYGVKSQINDQTGAITFR
jgi:transmembrane sensor